MDYLFVFGILVFHVSNVLAGAGNIWGYQDGLPPNLWPFVYRACGGRMQSPIDIQINQVQVNPRLGRLDLSDLDNVNNIRLTMQNNGHTVEVDIERDGFNRLLVTDGGLPGSYIVKQFHFHWGLRDSRGSEHDINGQFFPMEMHVVTYSSRYRLYEEAMNATGGLAVLSFLFEIGEENHAFDEMIGHLNQIRHKDDHVNIETFSLTSLFPSNTNVFYRYYGSLTTPPCYESVIWTVFQQHIVISERQINQFRLLSDRHFPRRFRSLSDNFRPTQPLNGRIVYTNSRRGLMYSRNGLYPWTKGSKTNTISSMPFQNSIYYPKSLPSINPIQRQSGKKRGFSRVRNSFGRLIQPFSSRRQYTRVQRPYTKSLKRRAQYGKSYLLY